jgi:hypothetical protein
VAVSAVSILVVAAMAGCYGQIIGRAFDGVGAASGVVLGALTGLAAGTMATVRPPDPAGLTWRRIEFFTFPIAGIATLALTGGTIEVLPVLVALVVVVTLRTLIESTVGDLTTMERMLDDRPAGGPPDRMRLRMLGVGLFLASVAGYTIGVEAGFTDLARPAAGGQMLAVVVWFGLGIAAIGAVSRRARQQSWRVNGVRVSAGLSDRWAAGVVAVAVLVGFVAVVTPVVTRQFSAAPAQAISETDGLNRFVTRAFELLSRDAGSADGDRPGSDDEDRTSLIESIEPGRSSPPEWIGDAVLAAIIATFFVWAVKAGRRAHLERGGRPIGAGGWDGLKALLAALVRELMVLLRGALRLLRLTRRRHRSSADEEGERRTADSRSEFRGWLPADSTERRIARSFANVAELEPPRRGETPAEVAARVGERTDRAGADTVLGGYLRARYSPEQMQKVTAERVEEAARRVTEVAKRAAGDEVT